MWRTTSFGLTCQLHSLSPDSFSRISSEQSAPIDPAMILEISMDLTWLFFFLFYLFGYLTLVRHLYKTLAHLYHFSSPSLNNYRFPHTFLKVSDTRVANRVQHALLINGKNREAGYWSCVGLSWKGNDEHREGCQRSSGLALGSVHPSSVHGSDSDVKARWIVWHLQLTLIRDD